MLAERKRQELETWINHIEPALEKEPSALQYEFFDEVTPVLDENNLWAKICVYFLL